MRVVTRRRWPERAFHALCLGAALLPLLAVLGLLGALLGRAAVATAPAGEAVGAAAALAAGLGTSLLLVALTALLALPVGVGAALYVAEVAPQSRLARFVAAHIDRLTVVPTVIYGLAGVLLFVRIAGRGQALLAGALTLAAVVLPVVVHSTRRALATVPAGVREAAVALGGTPWQVLRSVVLPMALPGIIAGAVAVIARALGTTAPLLLLGAADGLGALPVLIHDWATHPEPAFAANAAAGIVVLLGMLFILDTLAIMLRDRGSRDREGIR